jgi:hypothetical protein
MAMSKPAESLDWHTDPWFSEHHAGDISAPFKSWWLSFYGTPHDYPSSPDEQDEYWQRCAFAWKGWQARGQID